MNDDRIKALLRRAEGATAGPPDVAGLAMRVRRVGRRRRKMTAGAIAGMLAIVVSVAAWHLTRPSATPSRPIAIHTTKPVEPTPAGPQKSVRELMAEAELHTKVAELLWDAERHRQLPDSLAAVEPLLAVDRQRDRAALILIYQADFLGKQKQIDQAEREYRRAISLFPNTHWAAVARERLADMERGKEG